MPSIRLFVLLLAFLPGLVLQLRADQSGDFTFNDSGNSTATIVGYTGPGGVVIIPAAINGLPVVAIGPIAFLNVVTMTGVAIPNGVASIGSSAFYGCKGMASVTIPASVTSIGDSAFSGSTGLREISVDAANPNYSSLDGVLFNKLQTTLIQHPGGKAGSYAIPTGVTSIDGSAFFGCTGLISVTIPNSVASIGTRAFAGCTGLLEITVDAGNPSYRSLDGVVFDKQQTTLIQHPGAKAGAYAIPDGVTGIGNYAFYGCAGVASVTIPNGVTSIGVSAFQDCTNLASVMIPIGVTSIGGSAFRGCSGLASVTIPNSVTTIDAYAFRGCAGLSSVTIPNSVANIGSSAFLDCAALLAIDVHVSNPYYSSVDGVLFDKRRTILIQYPGGKAGAYVIPTGVTNIGGAAFQGCTRLASVTIPASVGYIATLALSGCTSLLAITVDAANRYFSSLDGVLHSKGGGMIQYPGGRAGPYTIPNGVSSIGSSVFYGCTGLTSLTIPDSVTTIASSAFFGCTGLNAALFVGSAPLMGSKTFDATAPGFTVYFLQGTAGFTTPIWQGYPSFMIASGSLLEWRVIQFETVENTGTAADTADPDGDGRTNLEEYVDGTNPNDPADCFRIRSAVKSTSAFTLTADGKAGRNYVLERNLGLAAGAWSQLATSGVLGADGLVVLLDSTPPAGTAFYRMRVVRP